MRSFTSSIIYFLLKAFLESPGWAQSYRLGLASVSKDEGGEERDLRGKEGGRSKRGEAVRGGGEL